MSNITDEQNEDVQETTTTKEELSTTKTEDTKLLKESLKEMEGTTSPPNNNEEKKDNAENGKSCEVVSFKVVFNKNKYDVNIPVDSTVKQLKEHLSSIINVLPAMQKVMIKGLAKDEKTLKELDVTNGSKVMVIGSKLDDVVNVNTPKAEAKAEEATSSFSSKEPLCQQKIHKKIIEKGVPKDAPAGMTDCKLALPSTPLSGMINKRGGKVRLTFKLEVDQLWIGTKERTERINMNHIRHVVSEPIVGHEAYHIMGFQLGTTEASRYWVYWVPAQYSDAIKDTVLGKWQ